MIEYLVLFLVSSLSYPLMRVLPFKYKIRKAICLAFPLLLFLLMMTLRSFSVGSDVKTYYSVFVRYQNGTERPVNKDLGFYYTLFFFSKIPGQFGFRLFLFTEYLLLVTGTFLLIYFFSENIHINLVILLMCPLFPLIVSGLRQTLGISLCLYALFFVKLSIKKYIKYPLSIIVWIMSCLMHFGSLSFALYYLSKLFKPFKKINILPLIGVWLVFCVLTKYLFPIINPFYNFGYGSGGFFLGLPKISILYFSLIVLSAFIFNKKTFKMPLLGDFEFPEKYNSLFQECFIMSVIFCLVFTSACWNNVAPRFGMFFVIGFPTIASIVVRGFKKPTTRFSLNLLIIVLSILGFIYENMITNACGTYPFSWF